MLKRLSLRAQMLLGFASLAVALLSGGAVGSLFVKDLSSIYDHVAKINYVNSDALSDMRFNSTDAARNMTRAEQKTKLEDIKEYNLKVKTAMELYTTADLAYNTPEIGGNERELYDKQVVHWKKLSGILIELSAILENRTAANKGKYEELDNAMTLARRAHAESLQNLIDYQAIEVKKWVSKAESSAALIITLLWIAVLGGAIGSLVIGYFFSGALTNNLRKVTHSINEVSASTGAASAQLSSAAQQLSSGATEGAASLEETVSSLEELGSMVKLNADNAKEAAALSQASRQSAENGELEIKKLITSVSDVARSSKEIEEIIDVIDDIAFQTNLLALNAAVEAARAGEQGKGFAVVAEAVRNLAQRSAAAAKDITKLIKDSVNKTDGGVKIADQSGLLLKEIVSSVKKVADLNEEISLASHQQADGLIQINKAMNQLDQVTQSNAASAEEAAASSEELSGQAEVLQSQVSALTQIVDGNQSSASQPPSQPAGKGKDRSTHHASVTSISKKQHHRKNSENVIPFESNHGKVGTTDGF